MVYSILNFTICNYELGEVFQFCLCSAFCNSFCYIIFLAYMTLKCTYSNQWQCVHADGWRMTVWEADPSLVACTKGCVRTLQVLYVQPFFLSDILLKTIAPKLSEPLHWVYRCICSWYKLTDGIISVPFCIALRSSLLLFSISEVEGAELGWWYGGQRVA